MHHQKDLHKKFKDAPNLGLFYFKFSPKFRDGDDQAKKNYLLEFSRIKKSFDRLNKRIKTLRKLVGENNIVCLKNESRFLCGSGYVNNTEWGLSFDWTTGVPYLPGSSLKGALLSYLEFCADEPKPVEKWDKSIEAKLENGDIWKMSEIIRVFGEQHTDKPAQTGDVIFFDVYPTYFKGFELDVITPHFSKYYSEPDKYPPADIYNPVPTHFLTIKPGSEFLFMFKCLKGPDKALQNKIKKLIKEAGQNYGFGAKTSSGYGYFRSEAYKETWEKISSMKK